MSDKRYMACPQCGQNMNLSPNATNELDELKSRNALLEKKAEKLREALTKIATFTAWEKADVVILGIQVDDTVNIAKAALEDGE